MEIFFLSRCDLLNVIKQLGSPVLKQMHWSFLPCFGGNLQVSGGGRVSEEMTASVEFTNPFTFSLEEVYIRMEGPGVMQPKFKYYR